MSEFKTIDQHLAGEPRPPVIQSALFAEPVPPGSGQPPLSEMLGGAPSHAGGEAFAAVPAAGSLYPAADATSGNAAAGAVYPVSAPPGIPLSESQQSEVFATPGIPVSASSYAAAAPAAGNPYSSAAVPPGAPGLGGSYPSGSFSATSIAGGPYAAAPASGSPYPATAVPPGVPAPGVPYHPAAAPGAPMSGSPYPIAGQPLPFAGAYPPMPAGTLQRKDVGAYFRAIWGQIRALFRLEMTAVLSYTKQPEHKLLYLFWLPLYLLLGPLLLTPLFELFYLPWSGLAAYASALLFLLLGLGIALGVAALYSALLKSKLPIQGLLNLLLAATLPLTLAAPLVALLLYPLPFLSMFLCLVALFWHELLLLELYKRFIGLQKYRAGDWLVLAAFSLRVLLGALLLYLLDYFLLV